MFYLIIIFIILVIIEYFWFNYVNQHGDEYFQDDKILDYLEYNTKNKDELTQFFKDTINERLYALKHMDYDEWLKYSQTNCVLKKDGIEYYTFIYEQNGTDKDKDKKSAFILRSSGQEELLDYNYTVERELVSHRYIILEMFPPSELLPNQMYSMELNEDGFNNLSYNWEDPFASLPVKKETIFTKFHKDNFNGVIGIGYSKDNLSSRYGDIYYNLIGKNGVIFFNIIILIIAIVLQVIGKNHVKTTIVLFLSWLLLMYQLTLDVGMTDIKMETAKLEDITSSVLGISFLVTVNTFIIKSFSDKKLFFSKTETILKNEITFLFCTSVLFLLFSLYKENNFKSVYQMRRIRVKNQLFFNLCVFYNVMICFIFLFFNFNKAIIKK